MIKKFINYVEVQTKITSFFTFLLVLGAMFYHNIPVKPLETGLFFLGMFSFDLTTTAINNYIDSKENGEHLGFSRKQAKIILFVLLGVSIVFGLILAAITDWIVLLLGMFCFGVGILYTFGPLPISRQPYGEIISGVMYGYFIPFIMLYINMRSDLLAVTLGETLVVSLNLKYFIGFLILGFVPTVLTSNIMLGNNTCDVDQDVLVKRFTLPYYIGKKNAVHLMRALYISVYVSIVVGVIAGVYHPIVLLSLVALIPVLKNVKEFSKVMVKRISFVNVIKNFIMVMVIVNVLVYLSILFK